MASSFARGAETAVGRRRRDLRLATRVPGILTAVCLTAVGLAAPAQSVVGPAVDRAGAAHRAATTVTPEEFGAGGDGVADDTRAVQEALDSVVSGGVVRFAPGQVYRHTDVLVADVAGSRLTGSGVLLATNEERSAVWITADDVVVDGGLTFRMGATTKRWDAWEQMKLRLAYVDGVVLRNITIDGAAAAGVFINGSSDLLLVDVSVSNTRADGIHMTGGSHDGILRRPVTSGTGDDGIAVVSSEAQGAITRGITVRSPVVAATTWGRGLSVVGGEDIVFRNITVDGSDAAAVYIACEGAPYYTYGTRRVSVVGGTLTNSNTNPAVDHGAVIFNSARPGFAVEEILVDGMDISGTRPTASWQAGIVTYGGTVSGVMLSDFDLSGGGKAFGGNAPDSAYSTVDWWVDGVRRPDHRGEQPGA